MLLFSHDSGWKQLVKVRAAAFAINFLYYMFHEIFVFVTGNTMKLAEKFLFRLNREGNLFPFPFLFLPSFFDIARNIHFVHEPRYAPFVRSKSGLSARYKSTAFSFRLIWEETCSLLPSEGPCPKA